MKTEKAKGLAKNGKNARIASWSHLKRGKWGRWKEAKNVLDAISRAESIRPSPDGAVYIDVCIHCDTGNIGYHFREIEIRSTGGASFKYRARFCNAGDNASWDEWKDANSVLDAIGKAQEICPIADYKVYIYYELETTDGDIRVIEVDSTDDAKFRYRAKFYSRGRPADNYKAGVWPVRPTDF